MMTVKEKAFEGSQKLEERSNVSFLKKLWCCVDGELKT